MEGHQSSSSESEPSPAVSSSHRSLSMKKRLRTPKISCLSSMSPDQLRAIVSQLTPGQRAAILEGLRASPVALTSSESICRYSDDVNLSQEDRMHAQEDKTHVNDMSKDDETKMTSPTHKQRSSSCLELTQSDQSILNVLDGLANSFDPPRISSDSRVSYHVDEMGRVIEDEKGRAVISRMRQLMHVAFYKDILLDWRHQPSAKKEYVLNLLDQEFPVPEEMSFDRVYMLSRMRKLMNHRRAELRDAVKANCERPLHIHKEDWRKALEELESAPNKFKQQKEAALKRQKKVGTSHLGSGGKQRFYAYFRNVVGREATLEEYQYAYSNTTNALLKKLEVEGVQMNWKS